MICCGFRHSGQQAHTELVYSSADLSPHTHLFLFGPAPNKQLWGRTAIITREPRATVKTEEVQRAWFLGPLFAIIHQNELKRPEIRPQTQHREHRIHTRTEIRMRAHFQANRVSEKLKLTGQRVNIWVAVAQCDDSVGGKKPPCVLNLWLLGQKFTGGSTRIKHIIPAVAVVVLVMNVLSWNFSFTLINGGSTVIKRNNEV